MSKFANGQRVQVDEIGVGVIEAELVNQPDVYLIRFLQKDMTPEARQRFKSPSPRATIHEDKIKAVAG